MNKQETIKLIVGIKTIYPNSYNNMTTEEKNVLIDIWQDSLQDYAYENVYKSLKMYVNSNTSGFAPTPAHIIENLKTMQPDNHLSESEAWDTYYKAICRSSYYAQEEYDKLPDEIKKLTSPNQMRNLALSEGEALMSSIKASFCRDYRNNIENKKKIETMPMIEQEQIQHVLLGISERIGIEMNE